MTLFSLVVDPPWVYLFRGVCLYHHWWQWGPGFHKGVPHYTTPPYIPLPRQTWYHHTRECTRITGRPTRAHGRHTYGTHLPHFRGTTTRQGHESVLPTQYGFSGFQRAWSGWTLPYFLCPWGPYLRTATFTTHHPWLCPTRGPLPTLTGTRDFFRRLFLPLRQRPRR